MPTISVNRDLLFKRLGREYSKWSHIILRLLLYQVFFCVDVLIGTLVDVAFIIIQFVHEIYD